ncbi:MAG: SDR family oxidoreductase [Myxococcales bacterium]|nr:SDR family oxidoreductase [Myxococcales bacterium]MCB9627706.1 SDR family oxidoreductase [Sandaracinaceae bacterium]
MKLEDLKIIVTGAARGMGAHFATRLHELGAQVAAGDVDEAGLAELPAGIHRRHLDVSSDADVASFVAWAGEQMGGLNALINNAGIIRDALLVRKNRETGAVERLSRKDWDAVLAVNLTGATMMAQEVLAHMLERDTTPGVIINISSIARHGSRGQSNYVAAKAALAANTQTWMREFSRYGIRVGAIAPGLVETPMTSGMNEKARERLRASVPLGRIGKPEDIFVAVKFILECDFFTGQTIDVDGGGAMG